MCGGGGGGGEWEAEGELRLPLSIPPLQLARILCQINEINKVNLCKIDG